MGDTRRVEIYFRDLTDEKQREVLEAAGINSPEDANWDAFPLDMLEFEDAPSSMEQV